MKKQKNSMRKNQVKGNKGSIMSGDDTATSKLHKKVKKSLKHKM